VEVRVGPSEIRSTPIVFNSGDATSSQRTRTIDISGDNITTTSGKASVAILSSSEENEGTCGRGSIVVSESFRSALPMNDSGLEATCRTTESQTNNVIALSSIVSIEGGTKVSFSPGDSLSTISGVGETSIAVSRRSGGRGVTAGTSRLTIIGNESTADVSSPGRNVVPDGGRSRETTDSVTVDLAVDFELRVGAEQGKNGGMSVGTASDPNGFGSSMNSSGKTQDGAHAERGS
jgi:hypothetical protein